MKHDWYIHPHDALIVVDVQNDFLPKGTLAVPGGNEVVPVLNKAIDAFQEAKRPVFMTRDWHPQNHLSFKQQGGSWPSHCIQGTKGAEFSDDLHFPQDAIIISKADDPHAEAYSSFQGTDLLTQLVNLGIKRIIVGGLATDYCVKATVLDARAAGLEVQVIENGIAAVNVHPDDNTIAIQKMREAGAEFISI